MTRRIKLVIIPKIGRYTIFKEISASFKFMNIIAGSVMYKTIFDRRSRSFCLKKPMCFRTTPNRIITVGTKITSIGLGMRILLNFTCFNYLSSLSLIVMHDAHTTFKKNQFLRLTLDYPQEMVIFLD